MDVGGIISLQSLLTIKNAPFNFKLNELFLQFLRQQMSISKFLANAFQENTICGGYPTSDHFES